MSRRAPGKKRHQGWIASLSNGETVFETEWLPGQRSPWHHLIARVQKQNLRITQLRLQRGPITVTCVGGADGYCAMRHVRASAFGGDRSEKWGVGTVIGNGVFMTWVGGNYDVYQDVYPLDQVHKATSLRAAQYHL